MARIANHYHCYDLVPGLVAVLAWPASVDGDEVVLHDHSEALLVEGGEGLVLSAHWVLILGVVVDRTGYQGCPADLGEEWGQCVTEAGVQLQVARWGDVALSFGTE